MANGVQVVLHNVTRGIQVSVKRETTLSAFEDRLALPVGTGDVPAVGTLLGSVSCGNMLNPDTLGISLVGCELLQLEEVPLVNLPSLGLSHPDVLSDSSQFLEHYGSSNADRVHQCFADAMVDIPAKPSLLRFDFAKVSFAGMLFGLQLGTEPFVTTRYVLYPFTAVELVGRGNGDVVDTPVNADKLAGGRDVGNLLLKHDMQKDFSIFDEQIGGCPFPVSIPFEVFRHPDLDFDSTFDGLDGHLSTVEPETITVGIITNRAGFGLGTGCIEILRESCFGGLDGFSGLHSGRDGNLGREVFSDGLVGLVVQGNTVEVFALPSGEADEVEGFGVGFDSGLEDLGESIQDQFGCTSQLHIQVVSHDTILASTSISRNKRRAKARGFNPKEF